MHTFSSSSWLNWFSFHCLIPMSKAPMTVSKRKRSVFFCVRIGLVCFIANAVFPNDSEDLIRISFPLKPLIWLYNSGNQYVHSVSSTSVTIRPNPEQYFTISSEAVYWCARFGAPLGGPTTCIEISHTGGFHNIVSMCVGATLRKTALLTPLWYYLAGNKWRLSVFMAVI